jgi:hypothetical protein
LPFRFGHQQIPGKSTLWACDGAVPNPDRGELILMAAGERIVAFARPGKPPGIPFFRRIERLPCNARIP